MEAPESHFRPVQVFQHVDADDGIEHLILQRHEDVGILEIALDHREVLEMPVPMGEPVHVRRVDIESHDPLSREQQRRDVADTRACFEHTVPDRSVELPHDPAGDLG